VEINAFRDVTSYSLVEILRRFGLTRCRLFGRQHVPSRRGYSDRSHGVRPNRQ